MTQKQPRGWKSRAASVIKRDGGVCQLCGGDGADSADHILPRIAGGGHEMSNLRAAHRGCNAKRGAAGMQPKAIAKRHRVPTPNVSSRW